MSIFPSTTINKLLSTNINNANSITGTYGATSLKCSGVTELATTSVSSLGVGKAASSYAVDISGNVNISGTITTGGTPIIYNDATNNIKIGNNNLKFPLLGSMNSTTTYGDFIAPLVNNGSQNTLMGHNIMLSAAANSYANTAFGDSAMMGVSGEVGIGNLSYNTAIGQSCMPIIANGALSNTAIGCESMLNLKQGDNNFAGGYGSLKGIVNGSFNSAIGFNTGLLYDTSYCTFLGSSSQANGVYSYSTALGYNSRITANRQIKLGTSLESVQIDGSMNVVGGIFINGVPLANGGADATLAGNNVFTGTNAYNTNLPTSTLMPSTNTQLITKVFADTTYIPKTYIYSGDDNLVIRGGTISLPLSGLSNTIYGNTSASLLNSGTWNNSFGTSALYYANESSSDNCAFGTRCMYGSPSAVGIVEYSCGFGTQALFSVSNGSTYNSGFGASSLISVTTGSNNTAMGGVSGNQLTTGSFNVHAGYMSGNTNTTNCTMLGSYTTSGAFSNSSCLGYGSNITADNQVVLGRNSENVLIPGTLTVNAVANFVGNPTMTGTTVTQNSQIVNKGICDTTYARKGVANAFTAGNSFNAFLPTSTLTPNSSAQLVTKQYTDDSFLLKNVFYSDVSLNQSIGAGSLSFPFSGVRTVNFGQSNGLLMNNASNNSIFGSRCMYFSGPDSFANCAFGTDAMFGASFTYGSTAYTCAFGVNALRSILNNTSGNNAFGSASLYNVQTGNNNNGVGYAAGEGIVAGSYNSNFGHNSNLSYDTSYCTMIGADTTLSAAWNNSSCFGYGSNITANNQITLGRSSENVLIPGTLTVNAVANFVGNPTMTGTSVTQNSQIVNKGICDTTYARKGVANAFTAGNSFNAFLPTSTLTPSQPTQFVTKAYCDATYSNDIIANDISNNIVYGANQSINSTMYNNVIISNKQASTVPIPVQFASISNNTVFGVNNLMQTDGYNNFGNAIFGIDAMTGAAYNPVTYEPMLFNSAFGYNALHECDWGGTSNTALGHAALAYCANSFNTGAGDSAGSSIVVGQYNTCLGFNAGYTDTSGNNIGNDTENCTMIGANTYSNGYYTNSSCLGYGSIITGSNQIVLGTAAETVVILGGTQFANIPTHAGIATTGNHILNKSSADSIYIAQGFAGSVVLLGGNNTITGQNTFSGQNTFTLAPLLNNPTQTFSNYNFITKFYADLNYVKSTESYPPINANNAFTGQNSFTKAPTLNNVVQVFNANNFITKAYADSQYITNFYSYAALSQNNVYTGHNTFLYLPEVAGGLTPTTANMLTNKSYVDLSVGGLLNASNLWTNFNTFIYPPLCSAVVSSNDQLVSKLYVDSFINNYSVTNNWASTNVFATLQTTANPSISTDVISKGFADSNYSNSLILSSSNAWTNTNTFNSNIPTTTLTPTLSGEFVPKGFGDSNYSNSTLLSANNTFTGNNTFDTSSCIISHGGTTHIEFSATALFAPFCYAYQYEQFNFNRAITFNAQAAYKGEVFVKNQAVNESQTLITGNFTFSAPFFSIYPVAHTVNTTFTLPAASADYLGVSFVIRRVGGNAANAIVSASANIFPTNSFIGSTTILLSNIYTVTISCTYRTTTTYGWFIT